MASPRQVELLIQASQVGADVTYMPLLVDRSVFGANNLDGQRAELFSPTGANAARSDGGDLRWYINSDQTSELASDLVSFSLDAVAGSSVTGADQGNMQAWIGGSGHLISSVTNTPVFLEYGDSALTRYANGDLYGRNNVYDANYAGVWHMEEDPSGTAPQIIDSSGNDNHGTTSGAMTSSNSVISKIGNGVDFDGINDKITLNTPVVSLPFTMSGWFNVPSITTSYAMMSIGSTSSEINRWYMGPAGAISGDPIYMSANDSNGSAGARSSSGYTANADHYAVGTEVSASLRRAYLDGGAEGSNTTTKTAGVSSNKVGIGVLERLSPALFLTGTISEARLSSIARPAFWISTEYNNQNSPSTFWSVNLPTGIGATLKTVSDLAVGADLIPVTLNSFSSFDAGAGLDAAPNTDVSANLLDSATANDALIPALVSLLLNDISNGTDSLNLLSGEYLLDTFTDANGTLLEDHVSDSGDSWINGAALIDTIDNSRLTSGTGRYVSTRIEQNSEYVVEAVIDILDLGGTSDFGFGGRSSVNQSEGYIVWGRPNSSEVWLGRRSGINSLNVLDAKNYSFSANSTVIVQLHITDALKWVTINGVTVCFSNDNSNVDPGSAFISGFKINTPTTGSHITSISTKNILYVLKILNDNGAGLDISPNIRAGLDLSDSGAGNDSQVSPRVSLLLSELTGGSDSLALSVALSMDELGSANDSAQSQSSSTITDAGDFTDAIQSFAGLSLSDSAIGSDLVSQIIVSIAVPDSGSGVDSLNILTIIYKIISDSALGSDTVSNISAGFSIVDNGAGVDVPILNVKLSVNDLANGSDILSVLKTAIKAISDAGIASDGLIIGVRIPVNDLGAGNDSMAFKASVSAFDSGQGIDLLSIKNLLQVIENATGAEVISAFDATANVVSIIIKMAARQIVLSMKTRQIIIRMLK